MERFSLIFLTFLLFGAEIIIAVLISEVRFEKSGNTAVKMLIAFITVTFFSVAFAFFRCITPGSLKILWDILFYLAICAASVAGVRFISGTGIYEAFYKVGIGLATCSLGGKLADAFNNVLINGGLTQANSAIYYVIRYLVMLCVYLAVFFIIIKKYKIQNECFNNKISISFCVMFVLTMCIISVFETILSDYASSYLLVLELCEVFYSFIYLIICHIINRQIYSDAEISMLKQLWERDKKHYELQKENVELINIKCHDLRHQIRSLKDKNVDEGFLKEIEKSIYIYDSIINTGNEAFDVIISDIALRCQRNGIYFTYMADGKLLNFMDDMDICSLFGNLLENALEYEQKINCDEKFISLNVKTDGDGIVIHAENYLSDEIRIKDGDMPSTTKNDKNYHGFGIKSMKMITEKYAGKFNITIADDMFQVDIIFPIDKKEQGK